MHRARVALSSARLYYKTAENETAKLRRVHADVVFEDVVTLELSRKKIAHESDSIDPFNTRSNVCLNEHRIRVSRVELECENNISVETLI
jgi:hypothetical protein